MFDLSRFSDTCSYCFKGIETGLSVCCCGSSLCANHLELHTSKFNCSILYSLVYDDSQNVKVSSAQEDIGDLEERINVRIRNGAVQGKHTNRCPHIHTSKNIELTIDGSDAKCSMCDLRDNLWVCLECGHVGCGRIQPGVQGHGHALMHFSGSANALCKTHGQVVLLSSVTNGHAETFCYHCQEFIFNPHKLNIRCLNLDPKGFDEAGGEQVGGLSSITGIVNEGQSCYINAVLHLLSSVFEDVDLSTHFELCESNPADCFCCQLIKILNELKNVNSTSGCDESDAENNTDSIKGRGTAVISISGFLKLVFGSEMFVQYKQEDCSEFLQYILENISNYEDCMLIPKVTSILGLDVESCSKCEKCDFVSTSTCQSRILYVPYADSLDECVKEYLKPSESQCACGGRVIHSSSILNVPKYMIVSVMRYKIEDHRSVKLEGPIEASTLDLSRLISGSSVSSKKERCLMSLRGCIVHRGKETSSGHYTWWTSDGENSYLVNDEIVAKSTAKLSRNGTVFLLSRH